MTTRIQIHEKFNDWAELDGHGCFPAFFARTEEECVAEAIRRGHRVTHHGISVVAADKTYVTHPDGTLAVVLGNIGIEILA